MDTIVGSQSSTAGADRNTVISAWIVGGTTWLVGLAMLALLG